MKTNERLLLIDSTKAELFVALINDGEVYSRTCSEQRQHNKNLNFLVHEILKSKGMFFKDLDAIAVVTGPGSWTGTRVGVVAVKAFALATGKPVIALKSCEDNNKLIFECRHKFTEKDFITARELVPVYDSEFKITIKNN